MPILKWNAGGIICWCELYVQTLIVYVESSPYAPYLK